MLILFLLNYQKSEVFRMVCFGIIACLDPAHSRKTVAAISRNSGFFFSFGKHYPKFGGITATVFLLCAGSRHATILK